MRARFTQGLFAHTRFESLHEGSLCGLTSLRFLSLFHGLGRIISGTTRSERIHFDLFDKANANCIRIQDRKQTNKIRIIINESL